MKITISNNVNSYRKTYRDYIFREWDLRRHCIISLHHLNFHECELHISEKTVFLT